MNNPIKKWSKDLNRYLTKKDIQVVNKPMTRCLTLYIITELQIKINPFLLLVGIQNRIATLEGSLATSYKAKYIFTIRSNKHAPWLFTQMNSKLMSTQRSAH